MPMMPMSGGSDPGLMQLLQQMAIPSPMANEASPVPMDTFAADRAFAAGNAFNPNPDTNGEGFLPLGNVGARVGSELGGAVEQQVAQSLVQSAMAGEIDLSALMAAIASYTTPMEAEGAVDPFMQQYQDAMPAAWGSQELTNQRLTYPWLDPNLYPTNTPQTPGVLY